MKCPVCSAEIPSTAKFCGGCGATITPLRPPEPLREPKLVAHASSEKPPLPPSFSPSYSGSSEPRVEKKYKTLRLIAMLYKVFAFVAGGACVLMALFLLVSGIAGSSRTTATIGPDPTAIFGGAVGGLILLIYGAFIFVFLYGLGEWMLVFMDIEENTRRTNETLASRTH